MELEKAAELVSGMLRPGKPYSRARILGVFQKSQQTATATELLDRLLDQG